MGLWVHLFGDLFSFLYVYIIIFTTYSNILILFSKSSRIPSSTSHDLSTSQVNLSKYSIYDFSFMMDTISFFNKVIMLPNQPTYPPSWKHSLTLFLNVIILTAKLIGVFSRYFRNILLFLKLCLCFTSSSSNGRIFWEFLFIFLFCFWGRI